MKAGLLIVLLNDQFITRNVQLREILYPTVSGNFFKTQPLLRVNESKIDYN